MLCKDYENIMCLVDQNSVVFIIVTSMPLHLQELFTLPFTKQLVLQNFAQHHLVTNDKT